MSALLNQLAAWKPFNALVVGDFMLDDLVYGDAERMSPDAPAPVLRVRRSETRAGGAANVASMLAALGGRVSALGVVGDDEPGRILTRTLEAGGVGTEGMAVDPLRPTTVKRSVIGLAQHRHPQKMFRMDIESRDPLPDAVVDDMLRRFDALLPDAQVVCVEDYNKGVCGPRVCRHVIERCRAAGTPVLVDPALLDDYSKYAGADAVTPNRTEAELATGVNPDTEHGPEEWLSLATALLRSLDLQTVVITLDRHGAFLLERHAEGHDERAAHVPTVAREVYDVTGAGDMVLAALAAARANGVAWHDAVRFANAAAGLEVEAFGATPIPLERIVRAVLHEEGGLRGKLRTREEAAIEAAALRREGRKIVFTNGCFDIIHAGHISLLRRAAKEGDALIVGLNSDESVRRLKGPERPVHDEHDRVEVLSELTSVHAIVLFGEDTPAELIQTIRPDVLVKGDEYQKHEIPGADSVESWGGRIVLLPMLEGRSTTGVIARVRGQSALRP